VERRVPLTGARVNVGSCVEQDADQLRRGLGIALTRRYRTRSWASSRWPQSARAQPRAPRDCRHRRPAMAGCSPNGHAKGSLAIEVPSLRAAFRVGLDCDDRRLPVIGQRRGRELPGISGRPDDAARAAFCVVVAASTTDSSPPSQPCALQDDDEDGAVRDQRDRDGV